MGDRPHLTRHRRSMQLGPLHLVAGRPPPSPQTMDWMVVVVPLRAANLYHFGHYGGAACLLVLVCVWSQVRSAMVLPPLPSALVRCFVRFFMSGVREDVGGCRCWC
jgi:hypothetical protein